jgi:GT2 family glycosyltransferase
MKIVALCTSYNRKDLTIRCIKSLLNQKDMSDTTIEVVVVDDRSTDGTPSCINASFPSVKVLNTSGCFYWCRSMAYGWDKYIKSIDFDFLLVFNDDVILFDTALRKLIDAYLENLDQNKLTMISGAFSYKKNKKVSYGGFRSVGKINPLRMDLLQPNGSAQLIDALNMNLVLIPISVIEKIGFLNSKFQHGMGDIDYSMRLVSFGGQCLLTPDYVGLCNRNGSSRRYNEPHISLLVRYIRLLSIKEQPLHSRYLLYKNHGGKFWIFNFFSPYVTLIFKHIYWLYKSR